MNAQAVESYLKQKTVSGASPETVKAFKQAFDAGGIRGFWRKELELALGRGKQARAHRLARLNAELGDKDQAFAWLEKSLRERDSLLVFLRTDPTLDPLRDDPRYQDLVGRIGL